MRLILLGAHALVVGPCGRLVGLGLVVRYRFRLAGVVRRLARFR